MSNPQLISYSSENLKAFFLRSGIRRWGPRTTFIQHFGSPSSRNQARERNKRTTNGKWAYCFGNWLRNRSFSWYFSCSELNWSLIINLFKLVNFQINFESRVKVWSVLEGLSRESTGHKQGQDEIICTTYERSAKTSMSFHLGRSRASRSKRPRRTAWERTTWLQGMEPTVLEVADCLHSGSDTKKTT